MVRRLRRCRDPKLGEMFTAAGGKWEQTSIAGHTANTLAKLRADVVAGNAPPAVQLKGPEIAEWNETGKMANLDPIANEEGWDKVVASALLPVMKPTGHWVAAPMNIQRINSIWGSTKAIEQLGSKSLPKTWAEFNADCDKAVAAHLFASPISARTGPTPRRSRSSSMEWTRACSRKRLSKGRGAIRGHERRHLCRAQGRVIHYTRCLPASVRTDGVRFNAVSRGATKTARFEVTRVVDPQKIDLSIRSLIRYGEPDEMADAVAFLAGPRSKYMSGQVLRADGGETLFPG